jgi:hypothetical protein
MGAEAAGGSMTASTDRLRRLIGGFASKTIVVVGDVIVDEYVFGKPARISREAPVLILRFTEREVLLGGAANAATTSVPSARACCRSAWWARIRPATSCSRCVTPPGCRPTGSRSRRVASRR